MRGAGLGFVAGFLLAWLLDLHHVQRDRRPVRQPDDGWLVIATAAGTKHRQRKPVRDRIDFEDASPPSWRDLENVDSV